MESTYYVDASTRRVPLTMGLHAIVDVADFRAVLKRKWRATVNGRKTYAKTSVTRKGVYLHRFLMNPSGSQVVDHINGNGLDCRRCNMRIATGAENLRNQSSRKASTSGFKGVSFDRKRRKWLAQIMLDGKNRHIGSFSDEVEAAKAHDRVAREIHGEFAFLNFRGTGDV